MHFAIRVLLIFWRLPHFFCPNPARPLLSSNRVKKPEYVGPGRRRRTDRRCCGPIPDWSDCRKEGNTKRAIRAYKSLVKRHPKDKVAPDALYRAAQLQEQELTFLRRRIHFRS
jgi:hypothetical protein